jgi:hypothetical protein
MKRKPFNYKLSEKDHPVIIEGLSKFVPVYVLAKKIGCSYHTLLEYIKKHKELAQTQKDAEDNMVAFAKGKLMQKVGAGHAASIMFLLERLDREHFGRNIQIENVGDLPAINIGVFSEGSFVDPIKPEDVGADAKEILAGAAALAKRRAQEEEARIIAEAEAAE